MATGWFVVQPPVGGGLTAAVRKVSPVMAGAQLTDGSIAPVTLKKLTVSMNGYLAPAGPMNVALKKLVVSMNGSQQQAGALAVTLPKVSPTIRQDLFTGAMVTTLKPIKLALALEAEGSILTRLARIDATLSGLQEVTGLLGVRLAAAAAILAGAHEQDGVLASTLKPVALTAAGTAASPITPTLHTFIIGGSTSLTTPAGSGYKIDRVALGGGRAGRVYGFGVGSNGGRSGDFAWDTLTEGVDFTAGDTINVSVGAGGASNGASGVETTITVGSNTLTGPPGLSSESYLSGYTGEPVNTGNTNSNKDLSLNGQTYVGGSGGTGSGSSNAAVSPPFPGGGGWGSNSNGINGRTGGNGCAWLYVYP